MRRIHAVSVLLLLVLTACTGGGSADPGQTSGTDRAGEIVVASGRDVTGTNGIRQQLIDAWNRSRENADFQARLVELPGSADQQRAQLLGALQSGSARYDVVNIDVTWVPEFAEASLIEPLAERAVDDPGDLIPSVAATATWNDRRYSVPFNSDVGLLYYRPDYLRAAGVERTDLGPGGLGWDGPEGLRSLINDLDERKPGAYEKGWTTQLGGYEGRTVNGVEAFAAADPGMRFTDARGHYVADPDALRKGIGELRRRTGPAYLLENATRSDETMSTSDFAEGRTAFLRAWPSAYRTLHQSLRPEQLGVTQLPGKAVLGGQNLAVTRDSPRPGKAAELIRFLTGKDSERCLLDAGFAAVRESAYVDDHETCDAAPTSDTAPSGTPTAGGEATGGMPRDRSGRPAYARTVLLPALRDAVQRPRTPLYGAFTQTFIAQLGAILLDEDSDDEVLAERLDAALRKALPH